MPKKQEQKEKKDPTRAPTIPDEDVYDAMIIILKGEAPPQKHWSKAFKAAARKIYRNKKLVLAQEHFDPLLGEKAERIVYENLILPREREVEAIVKLFIKDTKYDNAYKLHEKIRHVYAGISRETIQNIINEDPIHARVQPRFLNRPQSRPIEAERPMDIHQVDLVDLRGYSVQRGGKIYRFVLSILDVFSRFLWLVPLHTKKSAIVAEKLYDIYIQFGSPVRFQSDQGTEFKKEVKLLCSKLGCCVIYSRARHPESQGKVER